MINEKVDFRIEILHDHYKESFALIRDREKIRDRFFIWVILLFCLLFLAVNYPSAVNKMFTEIATNGMKFNPSEIPINILTSTAWAMFFVITIRYECSLNAFP